MGLLTKIYTTINNKIIFNAEADRPSVDEQKAFLNSFPEPKDDFERSYFKYRCLMFYCYDKKSKIFINTISFFGLCLLLPYYRIRGLKLNKKISEYKPKNRMLRKATQRIPIDDIFPEEMNNYKRCCEYDTIPYSSLFLTKDTYKLFRKIRSQHFFNFHYLLVMLIRLSQADYLLVKYSPKCIVTYVCEREFADPILTGLYKSHNVEYHGFMHGDYLFSIEQAFMKYTKYWIWEDHYRKLFNTLRCSFPTQIYTPPKNMGIVKPREKVEDYDYYATYYFGKETKESTMIVKNALMKLQKKGYKCKVRPHPRFSNLERIDSIFKGQIDIEDTKSVSIEESLECSYLSIAFASTVLSQAYYSGKKIVIDDISDKKAFEQLRDKEYILIDKADMLFSELLK